MTETDERPSLRDEKHQPRFTSSRYGTHASCSCGEFEGRGAGPAASVAWAKHVAEAKEVADG